MIVCMLGHGGRVPDEVLALFQANGITTAINTPSALLCQYGAMDQSEGSGEGDRGVPVTQWCSQGVLRSGWQPKAH